MKNNILRGVALLMALMLATGSVMTALAEDKKETVYVLADAEGGVNSVTVSERLYNPDGRDTLEDVSTLSDIENVGGDQGYTVKDGVMLWNAGGEDIRYEGTSDAPLPVSVRFTYRLDGAPISPAELAGKSGRLEIQIDYAATETRTVRVNGVREQMPIPFLMATVMRVDEDVFDNVEVTHGRVVDAGNFRAVISYGLPGAAEALHLDEYEDIDLEVPTSATVTADVKNFSNYGAYTLATSFVPDDLDGDDALDLDLGELTDALDDAVTLLMDGVEELYDGAGALSDGAKELWEGTDELKAGTDTLYTGASDVNDGAEQLRDGTSALKDGTDDLAEGVRTLKDGAKQLDDGAYDLRDGAEQLYDGTSTLLDGADTLRDGTSALLDGATLLDDGIIELSEGLDEIDANSAALVDGARQIFEAVIDTANDGLEDKEEDFSKLHIKLHTLTVDNYDQEIARLQREMLENVEETGGRIVRFIYEGVFEEILDRLPADSYVKTAFNGCVELAEDNINFDWLLSMPARIHYLENELYERDHRYGTI